MSKGLGKRNSLVDDFMQACDFIQSVNTADKPDPDTITLKRIYSTHCQACGIPFSCKEGE